MNDGMQGPMITYMARAPSDITKWSPGTSYVHQPAYGLLAHKDASTSSAVWFKVHQLGKTSDGKWAATDLLTASKSIYTFTIPAKLKAGQYLIRHEM